jgi:hypothetical protein
MKRYRVEEKDCGERGRTKKKRKKGKRTLSATAPDYAKCYS